MIFFCFLFLYYFSVSQFLRSKNQAECDEMKFNTAPDDDDVHDEDETASMLMLKSIIMMISLVHISTKCYVCIVHKRGTNADTLQQFAQEQFNYGKKNHSHKKQNYCNLKKTENKESPTEIKKNKK